MSSFLVFVFSKKKRENEMEKKGSDDFSVGPAPSLRERFPKVRDYKEKTTIEKHSDFLIGGRVV